MCKQDSASVETQTPTSESRQHRESTQPCNAHLESRSSSYNSGILELSTPLAEGLVYRTIYDLIPDDSKSHRHLTHLNGSPLALPDPGTHHLVLFCHYDPGFLVYDSDDSASNSLRKYLWSLPINKITTNS